MYMGVTYQESRKENLTHAQTMERIIQYLNTLDTSDKCDCEAPYKI